MSAGGLISIGAISVRVRKPNYNWDANPNRHGNIPFSATGTMQWAQAQSVLELSRNRAARKTVSGDTGVQEWFVFDDALLGPMTGSYLIQSFNLAADWQWSGHGINYPVGFNLGAVFLASTS